jgi:hypothetical protein
MRLSNKRTTAAQLRSPSKTRRSDDAFTHNVEDGAYSDRALQVAMSDQPEFCRQRRDRLGEHAFQPTITVAKITWQQCTAHSGSRGEALIDQGTGAVNDGSGRCRARQSVGGLDAARVVAPADQRQARCFVEVL